MTEVEYLGYELAEAFAPFNEAGRLVSIRVRWIDDDNIRCRVTVDGDLLLDGLIVGTAEGTLDQLCNLLWSNRFLILTRLRSCGANAQSLAPWLARVSSRGPDAVI